MVRFPKMALLAKARDLYQDYLAASWRQGFRPQLVKINGPWLNKLLRS